MAHITEDRVLENATANTTVSFTLSGAVTGFRTFSGAPMATNDTCWYAAWQVDANGVPTGNWENGLGTLTASTTLTRTAVLESSNANAAVSTFSGTIRVALTLTAARTLQLDNVLAALLPAATAEPGTPAAQNLYLYAREIVPGFTALKTKRPSGVDSPLQDALAFNQLCKWTANLAVLNAMGAANFTAVGTLAAVAQASGTARTATRRVQNTSAATAGALASFHSNSTNLCPVLRGNQAGEGGFRYNARFSFTTLQAGCRGFVGLVDVNTAPTNVDPLAAATTTPGRIGIGYNSNTGNLQINHTLTATVPTVIDLGTNFAVDTTSLFELTLVCRPFAGTAGPVGYRVRKYTTASDSPAFEASGTLSTNLPAGTSLLHPVAWMTNNATAASVVWNIHSIAIEADW